MTPSSRRLGHHLADGAATDGVDARAGLVEERDLRATDQREGEGQPPLLATGQLAPGAALETGEAHPLEQVGGGEGVVVERGSVAQRLAHPHAGAHAPGLQHHAHPPGEGRVVAIGSSPITDARPAAGRR